MQRISVNGFELPPIDIVSMLVNNNVNLHRGGNFDNVNMTPHT